MKSFRKITEEELELYEAKNKDYAGGGDRNGNFNRVASILSNYPQLKASDNRVVCLIYLLKQLDAVLWMLNEGYEGEVENIDSRLTDIHIYAKICRLLGDK